MLDQMWIIFQHSPLPTESINSLFSSPSATPCSGFTSLSPKIKIHDLCDSKLWWCRPTYYRIYKKRSTEGFQAVPYVVALFSAMLWLYYALLKKKEIFLITINSVGCIIETLYIVFFCVYASKSIRVRTKLSSHIYYF